MVRVEGIYRGTRRIGQELLCGWADVPELHREQFFHAVPEDFDYRCFLTHLDYVKKQNLGGYSFLNIKPQTLLHYREEILGRIDRKIVIELREDWMTQPQLEMLVRIRRNHPFLLSIDDFGTGASNLDRVKALSPNFIKIDVELFRGRRRELVHFVLFIKQFTDAVLVAEKVETEDDLKAVRSAGIEFWSGYYEKVLTSGNGKE
jgi:EAL domain-containing protein (putative c-di-GMP-specific phosphodiesterase class I)